MDRLPQIRKGLQKLWVAILPGLILMPLPVTTQAAALKTQVIILDSEQTLHTLARKYLGSADKWKSLQRLNHQLPRRFRNNPDHPLPQGIRILLPAEATMPQTSTTAQPLPSPTPQPLPTRSDSGRDKSILVDLTTSLKDKIRVAIFPFEVPRNQPDIEQYGTGTMDSLITGLKRVPQFLLIDRARMERILQEQSLAQTGLVDANTAVKVGKLLGAQVMITGSIQTAGSKIRIVANFIDVQTGAVADSQMATGLLNDIFDLQDQLAVLFIKNRNVSVTNEQLQRIDGVLKSTTNLLAYDYFLKGRKAYLRFSPEAWSEAVHWYQKAIETDPKYALAYAGLGETWVTWWMLFERGKHEMAENAYAASQKALDLNPDLPEAYRAFGLVSGILRKGNPEPAFRKALALNPYDAETWFYLWVGQNAGPDHDYIRKALELNPDLSFARIPRAMALRKLQRHEEAVAELREAVRGNPTNPGFHLYLGNGLMDLKRYEEAVLEFQHVLRINPNFADAHFNLAMIYGSQGRWANAASEYEQVLRLDPKHQRAIEGLAKARERLRTMP